MTAATESRASTPGRATDLPMRFEGFCRRILEQSGYVIQPQVHAVDFLATKHAEKIVAEAKLYRSAAVPTSILERAAERLLLMKREFRAVRALLLATIQGPQPRGFLERSQFAAIELWDLRKLLQEASGDEELYRQFVGFLREAEIGFAGTEPPASDVVGVLVEAPPESLKPRGHRLARDLKSIKTGKAGSHSFEDWCKEAVDYLFGDQLGKLQTQRTIEGGIYRADLISRIRPMHDLWRQLSQDFRTRYVVFEFKNYNRRVLPDQIFLTEKYLYPSALRCFAVIITRGGVHKNAIRAAKGVLRDSGKLILICTVSEVLKMLHAKDQGDDPNDLLWYAVDEFLTDTAP